MALPKPKSPNHWRKNKERFPEPVRLAEQEERKGLGITPRDYGRKWRAAFRDAIGDTPRLYPGDRRGAQRFLDRVREAIRLHDERSSTDYDSTPTSSDTGTLWTSDELSRLRKLEKVWAARASGQDDRFNRYGNRQRRVPGTLRADTETTPFQKRYKQACQIIAEIERDIRASTLVPFP